MGSPNLSSNQHSDTLQLRLENVGKEKMYSPNAYCQNRGLKHATSSSHNVPTIQHGITHEAEGPLLDVAVASFATTPTVTTLV